jgi:hypothetical protein
MSEKIDRWIHNLSLKSRELEIFHPDKQEAINQLMALGNAAADPLLKALDSSDPDARKTIISLLSRCHYKPAILPVARQLRHSDAAVRYEAICALTGFSKAELGEERVRDLIRQAAADANINIRKEAKTLLGKLGEERAEMPWFHGVDTWDSLAKAFVRLEIKKADPDFGSFVKKIDVFPSAYQHGAWVRVAEELHTIGKKNLAMRCYIEALHCDPDPNSIAWFWLNGSQDSAMGILSKDSAKTIDTIEKLRETYGTVVNPKGEFPPSVRKTKVASGEQTLPAESRPPSPGPEPSKDNLSADLKMAGTGVLYWAALLYMLKAVRSDFFPFLPPLPAVEWAGINWTTALAVAALAVVVIIHGWLARKAWDQWENTPGLGCFLMMFLGPALLPIMGLIRLAGTSIRKLRGSG